MDEMKSIKSDTLELVLFCTLFAQLFCGIQLFLWSLDHRVNLSTRILLTSELPIVVAAFFVFGASRLLTRSESEREREQHETNVQLERSFQLIQSLEAQRHDFRNHLQVIRTLAGMGKMDEIEHYIEECGTSLDNLAGMTRVGNAVLQALLLTFQAKVREMGIKFEVDCQADLTGLKCSPVKLSRIFSNILQNAAEAVSLQKEAPTISVAIWLDASDFHLVFWNNGPPIPPEEISTIFTPGFSKKVGEHRGYGLHIVKTLVEDLRGRIAVESNEADGTEFHVYLPTGPNIASRAAILSERLETLV